MSESYSVTIRPGKADKVLVDFIGYCNQHPEFRFWQALRNWSGARFLVLSDILPTFQQKDTFYWEGKDK